MKYIYAISDLHIGDGSDRDNFKSKVDLFKMTLKDLPNGRIVLVGDVFDIWAYDEDKIIKEYYWLIRQLGYMNAVFVTGNHDCKLLSKDSKIRKLIYDYGGKVCEYYIYKNILFLHGHQFDIYNSIYHNIGEFATKLAGTLGKIDPDIEDYLYNLRHYTGFVYGRHHKDNDKSRQMAISLVKNIMICKNDIDIVVVGHTHRSEDTMVDGINYINTGSYTYSGDSWVGIAID